MHFYFFHLSYPSFRNFILQIFFILALSICAQGADFPEPEEKKTQKSQLQRTKGVSFHDITKGVDVKEKNADKVHKKKNAQKPPRHLRKKLEEIKEEKATQPPKEKRPLAIVPGTTSPTASIQQILPEEDLFWIPQAFIIERRVIENRPMGSMTKDDAQKPLRDIVKKLRALTSPDLYLKEFAFFDRKTSIYKELGKIFADEIIWFPKAFVDPLKALGVQNLVFHNFPRSRVSMDSRHFAYLKPFQIYYDLSPNEINSQGIKDAVTIPFMSFPQGNLRLHRGYAISRSSQNPHKKEEKKRRSQENKKQPQG